MQMKVVNFREVNKGSLQGFLDIFLPELNWTITGCGLFSKGDRRWVSMPSRSKKDPDTGQITYSDVISMPQELRGKFSYAALQAYKEYTPAPTKTSEDLDFFVH
jgi:hypothetical protein